MSPKNVDVPMFELYGPPCENEECKGVLILTMNRKAKDAYHKCSVCGERFPLRRLEESP
jgi:hypothetical protein